MKLYNQYEYYVFPGISIYFNIFTLTYFLFEKL